MAQQHETTMNLICASEIDQVHSIVVYTRFICCSICASEIDQVYPISVLANCSLLAYLRFNRCTRILVC